MSSSPSNQNEKGKEEENDMLDENVRVAEADSDDDDDDEEQESRKRSRDVLDLSDPSAPSASSDGHSEGEEDEEDDIVPPRKERREAVMLEAPRIWQLSFKHAKTILFAYKCWLQRYSAFKQLTVTDDPDIVVSRQRELVYLTDEYYNIWTRGCSLAQQEDMPDEDDHIIQLPVPQPPIESGLRFRENKPGNVDAMAIVYVIFFGNYYHVDLKQDEVKRRMDVLQSEVIGLFEAHRDYGYCDSNDPEHNRSMSKVNNILMALQNGYRMLLHACAMQFALNPSIASIQPSKDVIFFVDNFQHYGARMDDAKPLVKLIMYMTAVAAQKRYRRYRDGVYEELITEDGYRTHFWKRVMSMEEFLRTECTRENNFEMFLISAERGVFSSALEFLCKFHDVEFQYVYMDRHVFSFRNGVYFAATRYFRPYSEGQINWGSDSHFVSRKDVLGQSHQVRRPTTNASANYFDVDFVVYDTWDKVPTPMVDKLLNDQAIPVEAQRIIWAMLGRIFYEVGELDDWQVICWLLGRANSGKSTLCKLVQLFYREEDVAVMSNNIEEQFGLEGIYDKLAFVAPEIKRDFQLPQALFQSMISGEGMAISKKNKIADNTVWRVPGIVAGNDVPAWVDNSNSIVRRIVMVPFLKPILRADGDLLRKLKMEVACIISKANQAYHLLLREYGTSGVWEKLPDFFKNAQNKLKAKTHPVYHFLQSNEVEYDPAAYISFDAFRGAYKTYVEKCNLKRLPWTEEVYGVPLEEKGLTIETPDEIECPPGSGIMVKHHTIVRGITLKAGTNTMAHSGPMGGNFNGQNNGASKTNNLASAIVSAFASAPSGHSGGGGLMRVGGAVPSFTLNK